MGNNLVLPSFVTLCDRQAPKPYGLASVVKTKGKVGSKWVKSAELPASNLHFSKAS